MNIEIELRYQVIDASQLPEFLALCESRGTKRVVDVYLDTSNADLIKKGIYIRLRDGKKMDIKFNRECLFNPDLELQPYCEEYTFMLPLKEADLPRINELATLFGMQQLSVPDMQTFCTQNNLIEHRIVDKIRASYKRDNFTITVDEVAGLGTFLEIELMAADTNALAAVKQAMEQLLSPLTLTVLKTGYDSLILRKQNFEQYVQGRFVLAEDKEWYKRQQEC
jgi:adenylate cyclase class IV